ncbi:MAG: vWA domain-containing protein [Pseudomonadales bacterium]
MIEWLWPWVFALLPVPAIARHLWPAADSQDPALVVPDLNRFSTPEHGEVSSLRQKRMVRLALLWLAWIALLASVARPQWTGEEVALPASGRDLMLAVDISGSMGTEDMQLGDQFVNRLLVVKDVVNRFLEVRNGDRVGLILFGTRAYLQAPLTFDLNSVQLLLQDAPVGIAGGKTAIGDAIGLAVKRLRKKTEGDRVLILLTDGANNVGEVAPIKAAELAAREEIKIYTIGVGADEMQLKMPGLFGALGSRIVNPSTELDEETLTRIAELTAGQYFRARNTEKLKEIYATIDDMEPVSQEAESFRPIRALYYWPLGLATLILLLLIVWQVGSRRLASGARSNQAQAHA